MTSLKKIVVGVGVAAAFSMVSAGVVNAKTISLSAGFPPGTATHNAALAYAEKVKELSNGDLNMEVVPLAMLSIPESLNGIRDGVVDAGLILTPLFVTEFPEDNLIGDLSMLGQSAAAMAGAATEYYVTCEPCQAESMKNNTVFLGTGSTAGYMLMASRPTNTVESLKGIKLRSANAAYNRWVEHFGGVTFGVPAPEVFEAIKQGTVEGAIQALSELKNIRLYEVVSNVTMGIPGGTYHSIQLGRINQEVWAGLTDEERQVMLDASAYMIAKLTIEYVQSGEVAKAEADELGVTFDEPSPDLKEQSEIFIKRDLEAIARVGTERGIDDAAAKIERFARLVEKWNGLTADINLDVDKLATVYKSEIYDKIDPSTYGR